MNVNGVVITSSPGPTPWASSAACRAVVPFDVATACLTPTNAAKARSNSATRGPCAITPDSSTRRTAACSSSPISGLEIEITGNLHHPECASGNICEDISLRRKWPAGHGAIDVSARIAQTGADGDAIARPRPQGFGGLEHQGLVPPQETPFDRRVQQKRTLGRACVDRT